MGCAQPNLQKWGFISLQVLNNKDDCLILRQEMVQ